MKWVDYRSHFVQTLAALYGHEEADSFFHMLLEHRLGLKRIDLALDRALEMTNAEQRYWDKAITQLQHFVPIQYIMGVAHFFGLDFEVNPSVLIPRPETEELVQWILDSHKPDAQLQIIDLCTGSGCIAIALAKHLPNAAVTALDVSAQALAVAATNAQRNGVDIRFIEQDVLNLEGLGQQYDLIVSNPPYVRLLEKEAMRPNVLEHEPHLALFVPDADALVFYRKIARLAAHNLTKEGRLYFEINQYLGKQTMDLLEQFGFASLELRNDIYGSHRMIAAGR